MSRACRLVIVLTLITVFVPSMPPAHAESGESTRISNPARHHRTGEQRYPYRDKSEYILKELDLQPGNVVVDIGAGDGWWVERMVKFVGDSGVIYAAEVEKKIVDELKEKFADTPQVKPSLCETDSTTLPENSCDLAFFSQTYHHLGEGTRVDYLKELLTVIKPTGRVVIIEKYTEIGLGEGTHGTRLSRLVRQAEEAGWVPVRLELMTGTYHYIAILAPKDLFPPEPPKKNKPGKGRQAQRPETNRYTMDSLETVQRRLANNKAVLVDVREKSEWDRGHLKDAMLVPLGKLQSGDKELIEQLTKAIDNNKILYYYCRSGRRTLIAALILKEMGYDARPLSEGYADLLKAGFEGNK